MVIEELMTQDTDLSTMYSMSNTLKNLATCSQEKVFTEEDIKTGVHNYNYNYHIRRKCELNVFQVAHAHLNFL